MPLMSIKRDLELIIVKIKEIIKNTVGDITENEMMQILLEWDDFENLEIEINAIFDNNYAFLDHMLKPIEIKSFDEENHDLALSLEALKDKVLSKVKST